MLPLSCVSEPVLIPIPGEGATVATVGVGG